MNERLVTDTMALVLRLERRRLPQAVKLLFETVERSFQIDDIPELHDRLIAGTAAIRQLPLLTNDPIITHSRHVTVIW